MRVVCDALGLILRFLRSRDASVSVDFVVSIPILLGVLVLTTEYGRVLQTRTALDNAVADAARYLTRVPHDGNGVWPTQSVAIAKGLITSRISSPHIAISEPQLTTSGGVERVTLEAAVGIVSPALSVLSLGGPNLRTANGDKLKDVEGLVVTASETFRHFGR